MDARVKTFQHLWKLQFPTGGTQELVLSTDILVVAILLVVTLLFTSQYVLLGNLWLVQAGVFTLLPIVHTSHNFPNTQYHDVGFHFHECAVFRDLEIYGW